MDRCSIDLLLVFINMKKKINDRFTTYESGININLKRACQFMFPSKFIELI